MIPRFIHVDKRGCLDDLEKEMRETDMTTVRDLFEHNDDKLMELLETGSVTLTVHLGADLKPFEVVFTIGAWVQE